MSGTFSTNSTDRKHLTGDVNLLDLIHLEDLQQLQDALAQFGCVKSVICDPDGHPLTEPSNDLSLCQMVRKSSAGAEDCLQNFQLLSEKIKTNQTSIIDTCAHLGILKAAVPIIIQGQHLANWWISQWCPEMADPTKLQQYALRIGIDPTQLLTEADICPRGTRREFERVLVWIESLAQQITQLGYKNLLLARDLSKMQGLEEELNRYKSELEKLVQDRLSEILNMNQRLKLEVLEREVTGEQMHRESKLLDAINQVLEQIFVDRSEHALAKTFVRVAQELTASPFGFMVEQQEVGGWRVVAEVRQGDDERVQAKSHIIKRFEMNSFWQELVDTGEAFATQAPQSRSPWQPLPKSYPDIKTLLAVPLPSEAGIAGFIGLANNPRGYAYIDQTDVQTLSRSFSKALRQARHEQAQHLSEKRLNLALDSAGEGLWDYLPKLEQIYYSPRWFEMLGYNTGELPYSFETWITLTHPEDLPILEGTFENVSKSVENAFQIEIRMLTEKGQWRWFQVRGRTVERDDEGAVLRMVGTLIDISKHKQVELALQKANEELLRLAALDDLTQIANRRRFDERLADEWRRARRDSSPLTVILCDIDYFKDYNDTYGHVKGDETLYAVAQAINGVLKRPMDLVARYGGEEFAMILPNTDLEGAARVAKKVKMAIGSLCIKHRASAVSEYITLSYGISSEIPNGDTSPKNLVEKSDKALYRAKGLGRNRIVQFDPEMSEIR
ncbi:MAG: diguanylate cyclase [Desulfobacteraceae bacterium]|nr:diguanylate cyclase [Desulfobacteraceae bacterium]